MGKYNVYTSEQLTWLKANYPKMGRTELTKQFNIRFKSSRTILAIASTCKRNRFKSGRTGCFPPGHKPWSAGTKGLLKPNTGSFKKGSRPFNWKPVGYERVDADGYTLIKTQEPNKFEFKHRVIWEKVFGEIKDGFVLTFIDGDKSNCCIDNLELLSKNEHCRRNRLKINSAAEEIKPTLRLIAKLQATTADKQEA